MATLCKFNASPPRPFVAPNRQLRPSNCPARPQKRPCWSSNLRCSAAVTPLAHTKIGTRRLHSRAQAFLSRVYHERRLFRREQKVGRQHCAAQKARRLPLKSKATAKKRLRFASQHAPEALAATARWEPCLRRYASPYTLYNLHII